MAAKETYAARLNLTFDMGLDDDGKTMTRRTGYPCKIDAEVDALHAVGAAFSTLTDNPIINVSLTENSNIF
ncbi:DUF1659 domain-containing protein [Bacillus piscicola]|uniref:DUF1659 domain-containing protein n=1 Tax=Bacillus piscicola TaxID=1632684 RepID=UPI001F09E085|nr:DUF1659 domain-containing protein [Bacillus piscicola]